MATYTDGFTNTNDTALNVHNANWKGVSSTYGGIATLKITSNMCAGQGHAIYEGAVGADCYVQAVVGTGNATTTEHGLWLRRALSSSSTQGLRVSVKATGYTYLYNDSATASWSDTTTWPVGTVLRVECEGSTARIYKNGSLIHTFSGVTDAGGTGKYAGLTNLSGTYWDDFEAGDLVAANQTASPTSDITVGSWTPSTGQTLYAVIDEVTPADADYIYTTSAGAACEVKLAAVSQPDTGTCTLSYRLYSTSADNIQVDLVENTTVRQTWNHNPAPTTVTQYDQTITTPANITDWANLRVRFTATAAA